MSLSREGRLPRLLTASLALVLLGAAATGCSAAQQPQQQQPAQVVSPPVTPMAAPERAATMPKGMPSQVPVPAGTVLKISSTEGANGHGLWTYTLVTSSAAQVLADWYSTTLVSLNWDAMPAAPASADGTISREYRKGNEAQVIIRVTPRAGGGSKVDASMGLGVPVTPAQ